ncbi:ABC transporter permease [Desulfosoma caldarium]|uniref:Peptide/nickel transport system permease protein/dipeptide transport system permease protein n=1 Tax=Desulfosoma caldarium TaxID=610254 RepID=A0A3N1UXN9_9BACT|nr:ABC transporter permease subunit [Desulfosoma caldarium]ROQ92026.1 peptide/nickel transport system permease protein/dipeptide transport system permease protein [Desulfosoma caldarium]
MHAAHVASSSSALSQAATRAEPSYSPFAEALSRLRKNKTAVAGFFIIVLFLAMAILAPVLAPHDPLKQSLYEKLKPPVWQHGGSWAHVLGTDDFGRDLLSRLIYGARISMVVGVVSVSIAFFFGTLAGSVAGFYGGVLDNGIMRFMDLLLAFPSILLAIVIVAFLGPSLQNAMIAIGVVSIPRYARLVRGSVLEEYAKDYVQAARALGAGDGRLIFLHILPNCLAPLIVQTTLGFASAILEAAALSFLGLGAQPPTPEWGAMLANGRALILRAWWAVTFPGLMILFSVLGFNLLGDGLRDALDPRLRE